MNRWQVRRARKYDENGSLVENPMQDGKMIVGVAGMYDDPTALVHAAEKVRDAGWRKWDCHSPYPVHGLEKAMGNPASLLPAIALAVGFCGCSFALWMQWWMSAVDYPVIIGGKEFFSWPAFVPICFELFVLTTSFTIVGCLILFCKLWRWHSPLYEAGVMQEVTRDKFAVVLQADDKKFEPGQARALLEQTGCSDIRELHEREQYDPVL